MAAYTLSAVRFKLHVEPLHVPGDAIAMVLSMQVFGVYRGSILERLPVPSTW